MAGHQGQEEHGHVRSAEICKAPLEQRLFRRCPILYRERLMSKAPEGDVHSLPIIFKPFVGRGKTCAISIASCFSSPGI